MESVKVCRICLIMDVNMYNLLAYPLETYFEPIIGKHPLSTMDLPSFLCYECAVLVKKFYFFRQRCLRGQAVLYNILSTSGEITRQEIKQIDRKNSYLTSNLTQHYITQDTDICCNHEEICLQEIKEEPLEDCSKLDINVINEDNFTYGLKEEFHVTSGENEDCDEVELHHGTSSDDDDKPLSNRRNNKKAVVKKEAKTKKNKNIFQQLKELEALVDIAVGATGTGTIPPKRKRGRPKKEDNVERKEPQKKRKSYTGGVRSDETVDENLEDYVTIVTLSLEEQKQEIIQRQHSSNYRNATYKCNLCYKGFIDSDAWQHHVGKHELSAGDVECEICKVRFKNKRNLSKHVSNHEKKYACKSCSYVSQSTTQAKQHQRWHKGVTYKCQYCDEVSTKWTSYLSHVRIKHPSDFVCDVCGYSFVSQLGLTMHKSMMHKDVTTETSEANKSDESRPYCELCQVKFVSVEAYKRHMVTSLKHMEHRDFRNGCRVCGETFGSWEEQRAHHRRHHARKRPTNYGKKPSTTVWPVNCEHCSEVIPNAREHWVHFRRAHPDKTYPIQKNYVCDVCGKSFRGNAFLVYHKRTHTDERAFKCAACGKAFYNRTNLLMHERSHSDSRPHPCSVCFKAFKTKGALERHFRCHTGVKPYECEVCGKVFSQSNSRKMHVRTVHLKQPTPYISRSRLERRNKLTAQKEQPQEQFML